MKKPSMPLYCACTKCEPRKKTTWDISFFFLRQAIIWLFTSLNKFEMHFMVFTYKHTDTHTHSPMRYGSMLFSILTKNIESTENSHASNSIWTPWIRLYRRILFRFRMNASIMGAINVSNTFKTVVFRLFFFFLLLSFFFERLVARNLCDFHLEIKRSNRSKISVDPMRSEPIISINVLISHMIIINTVSIQLSSLELDSFVCSRMFPSRFDLHSPNHRPHHPVSRLKNKH